MRYCILASMPTPHAFSIAIMISKYQRRFAAQKFLVKLRKAYLMVYM